MLSVTKPAPAKNKSALKNLTVAGTGMGEVVNFGGFN
jgi:hypothetical protein